MKKQVWQLKMRWFLNTKRYYIATVLKIIATICVAAVLVSVFVITVQMRKDMRYIENSEMTELSNFAQITDEVMSSVEKQTLYMAQSVQVLQFIEKKDFNTDVSLSMNVFADIGVIKNNSDVIQDVTIFSKNMDGIISNCSGFIRKGNYIENDLAILEQCVSDSGWVQSVDHSDCLIYYMKLPFMNRTPKGISAYYISKPLLMKKSCTTESIHRYWCMTDVDGCVLLENGLEGENEAKAAFRQYLQEEAGDMPRDKWNSVSLEGRKYLVAVTNAGVDRYCYSFVDKAQIRADAVVTVKNLSWIIGVSLLFGVLAALFCSRNIYSPVKNLVLKCSDGTFSQGSSDGEFTYMEKCFDSLISETKSLNRYILEMQQAFRNDLLIVLLREWIPLSGDLNQKCAMYSLTVQSHYVVIAFSLPADQMDHARQTLGAVPVPAGIINRYVLGSENDMLSAVLEFDPKLEAETIRQLSCYAVAQWIECLKNQGINAVAGIGSLCQQINFLHESYYEARSSVAKAVHKPALPLGSERSFSSYLKNCAAEMADCLRKGKASGASQIFNQFLDKLINGEFGDKEYYIFQSLKILISELALNMDEASAEKLLKLNAFYLLDECKSITDVRELFLGHIIPQLKSDPQQYKRSWITAICAYINEHIYEDITLQGCAEVCGVSPSYLSRELKKAMGVSFLDYVSECKVKAAQELLRDTDMSVSEVAERIGYSARNFYRVFQKVTMMSPNDFRQINKKE